MSINHEALLAKYIEHVGDYEGSDFLSEGKREAYRGMPVFTDEEWAELQRLRDKEYDGPKVV
jgi:hypothetical protein